MSRSLPRSVCFLAIASLAGLPLAGQEKKDALNDLLDGSGGTKFRLVTADAKPRPLSEVAYWRHHQGAVAASSAPVRFRLGDVDIIAPVPTQAAGADGKETLAYPTEGRAKIKAGKYSLTPGDVPLEFRGTDPVSAHPAIKIIDGEVLIRCAPIRLEVVDERGVPVPSPLRLISSRGSLLREDARFSVLTLWLPVGTDYETTLGKFSLDAEGHMKAGRLEQGVAATATGLRKTVPVAPAIRPELNNLISITVPKPGPKEPPHYSIYAPPVVKAGDRLQAAVSRREYQAVTDHPFEPSSLTLRFGDRAPAAAATTTEEPPAADVRGRAAAALRTTPDDLGWVSVPAPLEACGPTDFSIQPKFGHTARGTVLIADVGAAGRLVLVPYRWRTAFTNLEQAAFMVIVPANQASGKAKIMLELGGPDAKPIEVGALELPAVQGPGADRRFFTLNTAEIPPGRHHLWVEGASGKSGRVEVAVVPWRMTSSFFAHTMSGCLECWAQDDEGLGRLRAAGLDMATVAGGHGSVLNAAITRPDPALGARLAEIGLPAELAVAPTANDRLLDRMLHHQLRLIDLTVIRSAGMYLESLSYHHSYGPSVDRVVRHMQVFTQQTAEHPSFWGVNYSWFPALYGYAEGGVPTDAHVGDRNKALAAAVKIAGHEPLSREEQQWLDKWKPGDDRAKALALQKRALEHWKASQELGWAKHNALYNRAVHDVKPDAVCTLFENAGHDERKRLRAMFHDMNAQCYENYTDYGDWPLAAGFVTDWSRGQSPGQPVWFTVNWGSSPEGMTKNLFHAFARGLAGGGVPMPESTPGADIARRGTPVKFLSQYGALTAHATPERRVAILCRAANVVLGRAIWDTHAAYTHLVRLGFPPTILCDEELSAGGVPENVKALVLVNDRAIWDAESRKAVDAFIARGGKVIALGECTESFQSALTVAGAVKHLWQLKGFHPDSHAALWKEFAALRPGLSAALSQAGLTPLAGIDPERGYGLALDAGAVRYVMVIGTTKGAHDDVFEPAIGLPISLDGTGWIVRDLAKQKDLATAPKVGRTESAVDLLTEPATLLALYRSPPKAIHLELGGAAKLGGDLQVRCRVVAADGSDLGPVPVRIVLSGLGGAERDELFRAAGDAVALPLAALDRAGAWKVSVQELLTGVTAAADIEIQGASDAAAPAVAVAGVHVPNRDHLRAFAGKSGEKLVIVEPGQGRLLPMARKLVDAIKASGVEARLWEAKPEEFDMHPVRWYPTAADEERLKQIESGRLIGIRENLKPYIDTVKRAHVPERGGYAEIDPPYMVGRDCIVFSGGRLADSLQAVTPWVGAGYAPGRGEGRLVVCFSPFMANRQVLAVVAGDETGFEKATADLAASFKEKAPMANSRPDELKWREVPAVAGNTPVARPFSNFTPMRRIERLLATTDGKGAAVVRGKADNLAFLDPAGKVTATVTVPEKFATHARLDAAGSVHGPMESVTELHPGWGFPTKVAIELRAIGPNGSVKSGLPAYEGTPELPDFRGGILRAPDGICVVMARPGGFIYRGKASPNWQRYDDVPSAGTRFGVLYPRQPVGGAFSSDSKFFVATMDSRPPFGGLGSPTPRPTATETVLLDLSTGKRLWSLRGDPDLSAYAVHSGFAAVANDAAVTALADFDGAIHLIDKSGKVLVTQQAVEPRGHGASGVGPPSGVGVAISDTGKTAAFAFRRVLLIAHEGKIVRLPIEGIMSVAVSADDALVAVGCDDGSVKTFDSAGKPLSTTKVGETGPYVAAVAGGVMAANGAGDVIRFNAQGKELWRVNVAAVADKERHEPVLAADLDQQKPPVNYVEPDTLALARKELSARQIDAWKLPAGGKPAFGRTFAPLLGPAEVSAVAPGEYFVHLVYRRLEGNKSLKVMTAGSDGPETFWLDLPTPEYRVIDIPVRGPKAKVTVIADGGAEVAELSLWSFRWPTANLSYVAPIGLESKTAPKAGPKSGDDILDDLGVSNKKEPKGKLKETRVWWPNTDPDQVRGPWLPAPVDSLAVVDGKRFDRKMGAWSDRSGNYTAARGGFFTVDFGESLKPGFVATYDRAERQSGVCAALALFALNTEDTLRGGNVLGGAAGNDQFWRILPVRGAAVKVLGVHVFKHAESPSGLAEVEVYGGK